MIGEEVGRGGIRHEEVHSLRLHLAENRAVVLRVELKGLVHDYLVVAAALLGELPDSLQIILTMRGVLPDHGDLGGLWQPPPILMRVDPLHLGDGQRLDGRERSEDPLVIPLVDGGGCSAIYQQDYQWI